LSWRSSAARELLAAAGQKLIKSSRVQLIPRWLFGVSKLILQEIAWDQDLIVPDQLAYTFRAEG
jgi:hypothetical protein